MGCFLQEDETTRGTMYACLREEERKGEKRQSGLLEKPTTKATAIGMERTVIRGQRRRGRKTLAGHSAIVLKSK